MKRLTIAAMVLAAGLAAARCDDDNPNGPNGPSNTGPIVFTVQMSAANEIPALAPTNAEINARGTATITFNVGRDAQHRRCQRRWNGRLDLPDEQLPERKHSAQAHIHPGAAGSCSGVLLGIQGFTRGGATPINA